MSFVEGFGMTEVWPLGATRCAAGHLHWEPSHGLIEVLNPDDVRPGAARRGGDPGRHAVCAVP